MLAKTVELCLGSALLTGNLQLVTQPRSFSADLLASVARSLAVIDFHHGAFQHAMFTWAQKIYNGETLDLDPSDESTLKEFIKSNEALTVLAKAQLLSVFKS